jgi:hypothetical protein
MRERVLLAAIALGASPATTWAQVPLGPEFRVNSYTTSRQDGPSLASDANGNFVVVWDDGGQDGSSYGVFARRFDSSGAAIDASDFQVNVHTTGTQALASVASDASGRVVVTWISGGQDGSANGIYARRYDAARMPQGGEFRVNTYTTGTQSAPSVATDADGDFVIVWDGPGRDGSSYAVLGQRYDASGVAQGTEFRVNSYTTDSQSYAAVASDPSGNFVVVWSSFGQDGSGSGVFGQRYDALGVPHGPEFRVNSYTTGRQYTAAVTADADGNFVVAWTSAGQDGSGYGVFGQRYDANGAPQGPEFQVNSYTTGHQRQPAVTADANGNFVVAWTGAQQDGSYDGVFARRYAASGMPQGAEFQVNSFTTSFQTYATVASAASGKYVVAWSSLGQDGDQGGVFAQRLAPDVIFEDGFEPGGSTPACDPDGTYVKSGVAIVYSCCFGTVNVDIDQFIFSANGATVAPRPSAPAMTGMPTTCPAGAFDSSKTEPGGCTITYGLSGSFIGEDTWTGTYALDFTGPDCGCFGFDPCSNQSYAVTATR